ncbi:hypothetical protein [Actinomycetospora cinnamomea]|uniref:FHA domain-containing protein n=1 Tax=Actinomycetospora cinnamomea TaxID=663609 RepID=A0A2U1EXT1_9PSEU|nr:hypothetical protein [Actinomycetospora cinnamomea]PVZ04550.1 hypothetical protein C8D89_1173 [Actinomycetospora cinnamomea]
MGEALARVAGADGNSAVLTARRHLTVGRDATCDISFPGEARLSRRAVHLSWNGFGVVIANISRTHGLTVTAAATTARLPSRSEAGPTTGFFLASGTATIAGPSWPGSPFLVTVEVGAGQLAPGSAVNVALSATRQPFRLRTDTKEFLTALMLCRPRLEDPAGNATPPAAPQLTRQILEVTNSWHLVRQFDVDESVRKTLTGRVHEHLKGLRAKVLRHALVPGGTPLPPPALVDVLIASEAVTPLHLELLEDDAWLEWQESQWWES